MSLIMVYLKMNIKNKILVVCHDAGGAEILSAYVKERRKKAVFYCVVAGPAALIFRRKKIRNLIFFSQEKASKIFDRFEDIGMLLTGTGWASRMERDFIGEARKRGIKTASFLDHWVNYRERFGYPTNGWKKNLPDEIWVGDQHALLLAKKLFSGRRVKLVSNPFFREVKVEYKKAEKRLGGKGGAILFATEPVNAAMSSFSGENDNSRDEEEVLRLFMECLIKIGWNKGVIIRYHPSENKNKYGKIIDAYGEKLEIQRSIGENMYDDLAKSCCVVGMKSMFLTVASLCGKKVVSFLPGKNMYCPLPLGYIEKVKDMEGLKKILCGYIHTKIYLRIYDK